MTRVKEPLDLRPLPLDRWSRVKAPKGWGPIARTCRRVSESADRLTEHIVSCIEDEIPAYRTLGSVPRRDLSESVRRNLEMMFFGLAEHRGPSDEELNIRRELGHRRAIQGHPIDALLQAYHVGYRELWLELVAQAEAEGTKAQQLLLTAATTFWGWIQQITNVVAEAYEETSRAREALAEGTRQRFVDGLVSGDLQLEDATELARSLGFDPQGSFQATCAHPENFDGSEVGNLQRSLPSVEGVHHIAGRGHEFVVLSQGARAEEIETVIRRHVPKAAIGIGLTRQGLAGARQSILDARRVLAVATRKLDTRMFEHDWLLALVLRARDDLGAALQVGVDIGERYPHLAETVRAFATSGFSISETARRTSLHPNSVTYRLDRWRKLTGWDAHSFTGLVNSLAALEIAE